MEPLEEVCGLLPPEVSGGIGALPALVRRQVEEVRLRCGQIPTVSVGREELPLTGCDPVDRRALERTVEIATRASAHTALERVRQGYFTVRGGHRIGLAGTMVSEGGEVRNLTCLSSLNIRVARSVPGCGEGVYQALCRDGLGEGALILGPPGSGKTTLLRDLVRLFSEGGVRVGLADERGEVAGLWNGTPQFDVGGRTDVVEGCPKAQGLMMLLRGMNPRLLACDEVTAPADCQALEQCAHCGVALLATVHAGGVADLEGKALYRGLLERRLFRWTVYPDRRGACRVEALKW